MWLRPRGRMEGGRRGLLWLQVHGRSRRGFEVGGGAEKRMHSGSERGFGFPAERMFPCCLGISGVCPARWCPGHSASVASAPSLVTQRRPFSLPILHGRSRVGGALGMEGGCEGLWSLWIELSRDRRPSAELGRLLSGSSEDGGPKMWL